MPDSDWQLLPKTEADRYEADCQDGGDPKPGFQPSRSRSERFEYPDEAVFLIHERIWADVEVDPPPRLVTEFCSRCPEHVHTVTGDLPQAYRDHVVDLRYGDHRGLLYRQAHVTGIELKRYEMHVVPLNPNQPESELVFDGNGEFHIVLHITKESRQVQWFIREVDHYRDGVDWDTPLDTRACTPEGGFYVGFRQAADLLLAAVARGGGARGAAIPTLIANSFGDLLTAASRLRQPKFDVSAAGQEWTIALRDAGTPGSKPLRIEKAAVRDGRLKPAGDA